MKEADFISSIDCRFPYADGDEARRLIGIGCAVSANAAFSIAYELALPPRSSRVEPQTRLSLLALLDEHLDHPLKSIVLDIARRCIAEQRLTSAEVLFAFREISAYPGQYQALNLACMAVAEPSGVLDGAYEEVVQRWCQGA